MAHPVAERHLESIADVAARLGLHPRTIRRRITDGTLTGYRKLGVRSLFVDRTEVDEKLVRQVTGEGAA